MMKRLTLTYKETKCFIAGLFIGTLIPLLVFGNIYIVLAMLFLLGISVLLSILLMYILHKHEGVKE